MASKYYFKKRDKSLLITALKNCLESLPYVTTPNNKTGVFDETFKQMVSEFRRSVYPMDGTSPDVLDEYFYYSLGADCTDVILETNTTRDAGFQRLLYLSRLKQVTDRWEEIPAFVQTDQFIGWGHEGVAENCFQYTWKQIKDMGYDLKSPGWKKGSKMSPDIHQLFLGQKVAGLFAGYWSVAFIKGVNYLKQAMKDKIPVMVGVDDGPGSPNADKVTDHFITVVGMGSDDNGKFFRFYDNATSSVSSGTSADNKLYCNTDEPSLKGSGPNDYIQGTADQAYKVTQIRESK